MATQTVYALIGTIEFECEDLLGIYQSESDARRAFIEYQNGVSIANKNDKVEYNDYYIRPMRVGARAGL